MASASAAPKKTAASSTPCVWAWRHLWPDTELCYFAAIDADGDHFANELPNFVRAAEYARSHPGVDEVLVLGRRISRHRPMGFLRGELEELADRVLLDALHYRAARRGQPLRLECATTLEEFPDFHSGFKLFSRDTVSAVFLAKPDLLGVARHRLLPPWGRSGDQHRSPRKTAPSLVLVNRSTFNEQPISTFGLLDRARLVADKIIWPCKRLEVPGLFVDQFLRNHMPRLQLTTLAPQGRDELLQIRRLILAEFDIEARENDLLWGPLFV